MKRLGSSDSLGALMSVCPATEEQNPGGDHVYGREFQSMLDGLDDEGCLEEPGHVAEKKRRLSVNQVKALEKSFEVENKLEPERKVKLARELGLQPRQVAVWFQNRRARWKTKQLERDYGVLKANFDALKHDFDALQQDNDALLEQIRALKSKLDEEENTESNASIKEDEALIFESDHKIKEEPNAEAPPVVAVSEPNYRLFKNSIAPSISHLIDLKEGLSDSDSSAILNDDNSPNPTNSSSGALQNKQIFISSSPTSSSFRFSACVKFSETEDSAALASAREAYQPQFVKMEEHNFFGTEEACNFFSDEQPPSLHWYCPDQWT